MNNGRKILNPKPRRGGGRILRSFVVYTPQDDIKNVVLVIWNLTKEVFFLFSHKINQ